MCYEKFIPELLSTDVAFLTQNMKPRNFERIDIFTVCKLKTLHSKIKHYIYIYFPLQQNFVPAFFQFFSRAPMLF